MTFPKPPEICLHSLEALEKLSLEQLFYFHLDLEKSLHTTTREFREICENLQGGG
jgi:hypothetical protein